MIKQWGRIWYIIWTAGTAALVGLNGHVVIDTVRNPQSTPQGITTLAIEIEILQASYFIITGIIIAKSRRE
jgi:hypothetical protein